jgi:receptor protein-tyrosine kinase
MSKITKALEKAARERLQRGGGSGSEERVTVTAPPVTVPIVLRRGPSEVTEAGRVHIDPHIITAADPSSPIAEQYRILRTNIQSMRAKVGSRVLMVTSAISSEGKSVTAINLALTLARQEHLNVVLVDGDLRRSTVHQWLGLGERATGVSTALARDGEPSGSLVRLQSPPLTVLPAGPAPGQPAELLQSPNMKRLLAALRAQFDVVVIDAPPVLPVADPGIIASQADGVLLVVRAGKTQRKTVVQAQELLRKMQANLIGCVLTHAHHYHPGYAKYYRYYQDTVQEGNGAAKGNANPSAVAAGSDARA